MSSVRKMEASLGSLSVQWPGQGLVANPCLFSVGSIRAVYSSLEVNVPTAQLPAESR